MNTLKAPPGVTEFQIDGIVYETDEDGMVFITDAAHLERAKIHGFRPPHAAVAQAAPAAAPAAPAPYMTGPYHMHLRWLRDNGVEIDDDAADAAVLYATEELHKRFAAGDEEEAETEAKAIDPETASQPEMVKWLKSRGVAVAGNISKTAARKIVAETLAEQG